MDVYHARQHLWELARKLHPNEEANQNRWILVHQDLLEEGKIEDLLSALRSIATSNGERMEKIAPKRNTLNATRSACSTVSCAVSTCLRYRRHRGWVQDRDRFSLQAVGHVLDCTRGQRHLGFALLSNQWPF